MRYFTLFPSVRVTDRSNGLPFSGGQRSQSGNASGKAGLIHGIRIQPDENADKRDQDQPGILADPFLRFYP